MTQLRSVMLADPVRTAIGTFGGSLKELPAADLGAVAIGAAVERAGLKPDEIGTVVMGNVIQAGAKMNPSRQAAIQAGLPVSVPAMTVNRVCGSGAQAIVSAAHEIMSGAVDVAVAGGMENMDLAPYLMMRGRWGYRMGDGQLYDSMLRDGLNDAFSDQASGWHTEDLAQKFQIGREAQDQWALRSQQRFAAAQAAGKFKGDWSEWTNSFLTMGGDAARQWLSQLNAGLALTTGAPGFFVPRVPAPWLHAPGTTDATSAFDTSLLKATLNGLIDFERLNAGPIRLSVGAVNVRTGNFVYFDTKTHSIGPEHLMASAALPPGFPAIEIEGEHYWDGGLVSNTPLQWVVDSEPRVDTLAFQVDLWSARGELPRTIAEVSTRQKEIQYSSRTRAGTDSFKHVQRLRRAVADLLEKLPQHLQDGPEAQLLRPNTWHRVYNIIHLIYRAKNYEGH
jgi:predicted acylesterase/phospholipase RssA